MKKRGDNALYRAMLAGVITYFAAPIVALILFRNPLHAAIGSCAAPLLVAGIVAILSYRSDEKIEWPGQGKCSQCGYDLTGNVSGKCPECGNPCESSNRLDLPPRRD